MNRLFILTIFILGSSALWAQPKSPGSDSLDVISYSINIDTVDIPNQLIYGYTDIYFQPEVNNLQYLPLDLLNLTVDSVFLESVLNSSWTYNDTLLKIHCPAPLAINDTFHLKIFYHGHPVIDPSNWGGFYFQNPYVYNLGVGFEDNPHCYGRVWFPCIDDFDDKAYYEYYITTDTNQMAVCGGMLTDTTHIEFTNRVAWHWKMDDPIPTYLASMAVGPYMCVSDTFNSMNGAIPIDIYVASSYVSKVPGTFVHLNEILAAFENHFGPYLWQRVGYVGVPFNSGAMEHATNIALPNAAITGNTANESLCAHELSHHWFGNLVTCATAEEMWINEGWAVFSEFIVEESLYGYQAMQEYIQSVHASVLKSAHIDDGGFFPVGNVPHEITYGTTVYDKGALVVHTLRNYMGDSLFFPAVKTFLDSLKFGNASNDQMRDIFSYSSGIDLTDFFEAWVLREGFPHFDVDSMQVVPAGGNATVTVYLRQKLYGTNVYANSNRVELTFMDSLWNSYSVTAEFSGTTGTDVFTVPFTPSLVVVDKEEKTSDAIISYNKIISNTGTFLFANAYVDIVVSSLTDSIYVRAEHHKVAPDPVISNPAIYRISTSRYWRISGLIPEGTDYTLKFDFARTTAFFDAGLLPSSASVDSLILIYRPGAGYDWEIAPFERGGNTIAGVLTANYGRMGEYALAIGEPGQSGIPESRKTPGLKVFPNPCSGILTVENFSNDCVEIAINDLSGKTVLSKSIGSGTKSLMLNTDSLSAGQYLISEFDSHGNRISQSKLTVTGL